MYAEIIAARRTPMSLPFFNYAAPENLRGELRAGQLIKMPFRNKMEFGVVKKIIGGHKEKLKDIAEIACPIPFLSAPQLSWLEEMADFYKTSLGFLVKTNLPPLQKRKLAALAACHSSFRGNDAAPIKKQISKPILFIYSSKKERDDYFTENIPNAGQVLILFPELSGVDKIKQIFSKKILDEAVIVTSELSVKQSFDAWIKIWSGEKRIVIGARAALFMPWKNLSAIFMEDEGNPNYKSWDMAPRFHARDAIIFLNKYYNCQIRLLTHTPSVESYFFAEHNIYAKIGEIKRISSVPEIINMKDEKRRGNYGCFGEELMDALKSSSGQAFLFVNRLGSFGYVICRDCGQISICEKCGKPLSYLASSKTLRCNNCRIEMPIMSNCQKCRGENIKTFGVGTQAAEVELKKLFPDKKIIRLDSDNPNCHSRESGNRINVNENCGFRRNDNARDMDVNDGAIIIGTDYAWPRVNWERLDVMAFLDADAAMFIPEFKTMENIWLNLRDTAFRLPAAAKWFIQTSRPEHLIFSHLYAPNNFYQQELKERKMLGYPPYNYLMRAIISESAREAVEIEAKKAYNILIGLTKKGFAGKIIGPHKTEPYWRKGRYSQVILAKIPYSSYKSDVKLLVSKLTDKWKIDPNPNSILT